MGKESYDIIVIGAGPSGLSCAIEAKKKGFSCVVLDKGSLTDAIRRFPINMTFFSTPELLEIGNVPFVSSGFRPTRFDALRYYQGVTKFYELVVKSGEQVLSIEKKGASFDVRTNHDTYAASNVVMATGYFDNPNPYEVPGATLPKVLRYYSEPFEYVGREVAIVGGKNSAVEIALDLFRSGAKVTLIHKGSKLTEGVKYWVLPDIENRIKAGEIKALFETQVKEIREHSLILSGKRAGEIPNDFVFVMIGYRPDNSLLMNAGVQIDENSLAPFHNPGTMETNIKGLFVAGSIAAGKFNNKIFIENGRAHGKLIVDAIEKAR